MNATGADFVFEQDYELKSLEVVEQYIKDNKRLPDIELASQMEENGLELGKMEMKLLQKVEELTLYMIELKKEINKMKEKNQILEEEVAKIRKTY